ncbi:MAG: hypothetical protein ACRDKW_18280 [Actinomycetota bacterium]
MAWRIRYHPNQSVDTVREHNRRVALSRVSNPDAVERAEILALGLEGATMEPMDEPEVVLTVADVDFQDEVGNLIWIPPDDPPWGQRGGTYSYEHVP